MTKIKVCGITNINDAFAAVKAGADALGFVFYKKSPRFITPSKARRIIDALPPFVTMVGIFVNERSGAVKDIATHAGLDTIQLHGDEDTHTCNRFKQQGLKVIKSFRVKDDFSVSAVESYHVSGLLFDAFSPDAMGGTGQTFNWAALQGVKFRSSMILSGGLTPTNVAEAIRTLRPYAVDVSSGVEKSPGQKDQGLIERFVKAVRSA